MEKLGGEIRLMVNGEAVRCMGEFTHRPSVPKRSAVVGTNEVTGYSEEIQVPFIEGALTDSKNLSLTDFFNITDATITLVLANGKTFVLTEAFYAGSAEVKSKESEVNLRFEGKEGEYI